MPRAAPRPFPWSWDRLLREEDPFRVPRVRHPQTPFDALVDALAELELVSIAGAARARRLTEAWVRAHELELRDAPDARTLYGLLHRYQAEVVRPAWDESETRGRRARAKLQAGRSGRVAARRRAAAASDPGPVSTPALGRAWATESAITGPLYHATRAGPAILREGLIARKAVEERERAAGVQRPGRGTLGGGPEHVVSLTSDRAAARRIAAALQALNEAHREPEGVYAWFVEHWLPYLERWNPPAGARYRNRQWYGGPSAQRVKEMMSEVGSYSIGQEPPTAMRVPWIMGTPTPTAPENIGVVTAYANIDQLYKSGMTGRDRTWGRIVKGWTAGMDGFGNVRTGCPTVRGGPRAVTGGELPRPVASLAHAALAEATLNPSEANEVRVCPEDLTVVGFEPVLDWREILMPNASKKRRTGSKADETVPIRLSYAVFNVFQRYWTGQWDPLYAVLSRRGPSVDWVTVDATPEEIERLDEVAEEIVASDEAEPGEVRTAVAYLGRRGLMSRQEGTANRGSRADGAIRKLAAQIKSPADLAKTIADPHLEQWRRCALAVYRRLVGAGEDPGQSSVRRAFAICTSRLQDAGYLEPGTRTPTAKGRARAMEKLGDPEAKEKHAAYEQMLRAGRGGRPSRQERKETVRGLIAEAEKQARKVVPFRARPRFDLDALIERTRPTGRRSRRRGAADRRGARAAAQDDRPSPLETAVALQQAALQVFTCDTAFGTCDPKHPSQGHCLLASMAFQDLVGGDIRSGVVRDTPHYWNRVGKTEFDLTADQFGMPAPRWRTGTLYKPASRFLRCKGETLMDVGDNVTVNRMYGRFTKRLAKVLKEAGHEDLAGALR